MENQQVCGFIVCGKVRVKNQEYKAIDLMNIEPWENDTALRKAWWSLKVIDNNRLAAAVNLLSFMVNSFTSNTDTILVENLLTSSETDYSLSRHEKKRIAVLRYIEANLYSKLTLDSVAAHVCLSANYFSRFFKKRQGINFKTWVNQRRMYRAGELLRNTDQTIDHIARKLQYAQTSYFCRVFHATYHMSPQMYRRHR
ncbi:AraC family transcriptional regulator [Salmonella enterica]|nr:AraC family transcriptional regulator [Salmonella enterica]